MSDSVRPHRRKPTRLPCPWDSPSKNTGVGCHFLLQCMKVKSEREVAQSCLQMLILKSANSKSLQPVLHFVIRVVFLKFSLIVPFPPPFITIKLDSFGVAEGRTRLRDFTFTFHFHALEKEMATHSSVLAWRIPRTGEPGGLTSLGSHRADMTEAT